MSHFKEANQATGLRTARRSQWPVLQIREANKTPNPTSHSKVPHIRKRNLDRFDLKVTWYRRQRSVG